MPKIEFAATGTTWVVDIADTISKEELAVLSSDVIRIVNDFENRYSRFRDGSVTLAIGKPGNYQLPEDAEEMFEFYWRLNKATDGKFTPLIGETLVNSGYDKDYSFSQRGDLRKVPWLTTAVELKYPNLVTKQEVVFDFGAAGKGYAVDIVAHYLRKNLKTFSIDAGGDILFYSKLNEEFKVGLENPGDKTQVLGVAHINNKSICGSSSNRRRWKKFHHIFDAKTLNNPDEVLATWVIADTTIVADGIATALFFTPPEVLLEHFEFEYLVLNSDYSARFSQGFPAELF